MALHSVCELQSSLPRSGAVDFDAGFAARNSESRKSCLQHWKQKQEDLHVAFQLDSWLSLMKLVDVEDSATRLDVSVVSDTGCLPLDGGVVLPISLSLTRNKSEL